MSVLAIDHVQYCFPPGGLERERVFWRDVMGLPEVPRPAALAARLEGAWFQCGAQQIHIGAEQDFRPARKGHVALQCADLLRILDRLKAAGHEVRGSEEDIPGVELRFFTDDAFGNRIELVQLKTAAPRSESAPTPPQVYSLPTTVTPADVVLLGDPRLRQRSAEVTDYAAPSFKHSCAVLACTLAAFRAKHGFGRAISMPQIGVSQRVIALNLGEGVFFMVNPIYTHKSVETFTVLDDCMSFPDLLVRVRRHQSVSLAYTDEEGRAKTWERLPQALSELVQHEIDHLDGVLAVDLAAAAGGSPLLVLKAAYDANKAWYRTQVDYIIGE